MVECKVICILGNFENFIRVKLNFLIANWNLKDFLCKLNFFKRFQTVIESNNL